MLVEARAGWLSKRGNAEDEYEDAFWPARAAPSAKRIFRCAIADGATETSFSGLWARLLTEAYGRGQLGARRWRFGLSDLRHAWGAEVGHRPLPWYAEEKLRQGAFAALLGLTLSARPDGSVRWSALAVGDCCLFQIRDDRLVSCFPLATADAFNSRPVLVGSVCPPADREAMFTRRGGEALPGDRFVLMSDALACWFLAAAEVGCRPWQELEAAETDFMGWIGALRNGGGMRNDDVTMLTVDLVGIET
jgi:hypothetical protein